MADEPRGFCPPSPKMRCAASTLTDCCLEAAGTVKPKVTIGPR